MIAGAELLPVITPTNPASTNPANETARELTGIKQHLFCKSRSSEVGHLASMVR